TVSVMPLLVWVLNPSNVAVTWYGPGSRLGTLYSPSALVTTLVTTPVATLLIDTVAYGSAAPLWSLTRPTTVPPTVWPLSGRATRHDARHARAITPRRMSADRLVIDGP